MPPLNKLKFVWWLSIIAVIVTVSVLVLKTLTSSGNNDDSPQQNQSKLQTSRSNADFLTPEDKPRSQSIEAHVNAIPLTTEYLKNAALDLTTAKMLLSRCEKEVMDIDKRSALASMIIGALCRQGMIDDAWSLISSNPGSVRTSELSSFFLFSKYSSIAQISGFMAQLQDPSERQSAIFGLVQGHPEDALKLEASIIPGENAAERQSFTKALSLILQSSDNPDLTGKLITRVIQLAAVGKLEPGHLLNILDSDRGRSPLEQWDILQHSEALFDKRNMESIYAGLAKRMVGADLNKAMSEICSDQATKYSYPVLSAATRAMFEMDTDAANSWVSSNLDKLDPATSQRLISCLAQVANQNLEFETSRMWANRILNPEVRQQLLDQVNKRESEKTQNPLGN